MKTVDGQAENVHERADEHCGDDQISRGRPNRYDHPVRSPVADVAQRGQKNHQIDRTVLGRHHAEVSDHRVLRAADRLRLLRRHEQGMRREPDQKTHPQIPIGSGHAGHALPEIVIGANEERPHGDGLQHEHPTQHAAHHCHAQLLPELIDRSHQPVPREWHGNQRRHREEHKHVPHPIVIALFVVAFCRQEAKRRISQNHRAARHHVRKKPVQIERIPQRGMEKVPRIAQITSRLVNAGRRHHKGDPGVRQE